MLKVISNIQTATGEYGSLRSEVVDNEGVKTISISKGMSAGLLQGKVYVPKYHFKDMEEVRELQAALADAIVFFNDGV